MGSDDLLVGFIATIILLIILLIVVLFVSLIAITVGAEILHLFKRWRTHGEVASPNARFRPPDKVWVALWIATAISTQRTLSQPGVIDILRPLFHSAITGREPGDIANVVLLSIEPLLVAAMIFTLSYPILVLVDAVRRKIGSLTKRTQQMHSRTGRRLVGAISLAIAATVIVTIFLVSVTLDGPEKAWMTTSEKGALAMVQDVLGNTYVVGDSYAFPPYGYSTRSTVTKYASDGRRIWVGGYAGPGTWEKGRAVALDRTGNVYVAGISLEGKSDHDYTVIKYSSEGTTHWTRRYNSRGSIDATVPAMAIDKWDNVYVSVISDVVINPHRRGTRTTIKYDSDGNELWISRDDKAGNDNVQPKALALDGESNVYITGPMLRVDGDASACGTIKLAADGRQLWLARYQLSSKDICNGRSVATDADGNAYISGIVVQGGRETYSVLVKYDPNGNQLWDTRHEGVAEAFILDEARNSYVTGKSGRAFVTAKYGPDGNILWLMSFGGPVNDRVSASALAVDKVGSVYIAGTQSRRYFLDFQQHDYVLFKYTADGSLLWTTFHNQNSYGTPSAMIVDSLGDIVVTGSAGTMKFR
jgi:hypothetical protein